MRITYDKESDAATIYIVDDIGTGGAPRSMMCDLEIREGAVILLFSPHDELVGIEVLGASKVLPERVLNMARLPESPAE